MKILDLSVPMINTAKEPYPAKIEYTSHEAGAIQAAELLGLKPWIVNTKSNKYYKVFNRNSTGLL